MNKPGPLLALLLLFCPALPAAQLPPDFTASYSVQKYGSQIAEMRLSLQTRDNIASYSSHSEARGLAALLTNQEIDETSELDISDAAAPPRLLRYQYRHRGRANKNQQFQVDYLDDNQVRVEGSYGKQPFQLDSEQPVWDQLSVQLALLATAQQSPTSGQQYRYTIIDDGKIDEYAFEFGGEAVLKIAERTYHTLKFTRVHGKRTTSLWLAQELHYLPVKIDQYKEGELNLRMTLEQIKP